MKIYKRTSFLVVALILGITSTNAKEMKQELKIVLELGKQMSSMRNMLESYALVATDVEYKDPEKRLEVSIKEYEKLLALIDKTMKDKDITASLKASKKAWKPVKEAFLSAKDHHDHTAKDDNAIHKKMMDEGVFIHANIRSVIRELAKMKEHILKEEKIKHSDELNAAIEIAASSQRLSAHYMMKMWGLPDPTIQEHWDKGVKIYTDSIAILKKSVYYKDPKFKKELDSTEKNLNYFITVMMFDDKYVPVLVHEKAQFAFESANKMGKTILMQITK
jgi:hypothetical protein